MGEFVLGRKVGVDHAPARLSRAQQLRQAMVTLWTDDHVHRRLATQNLGAFGLGDATGDHKRRPPAGLFALLLQLAQLAELGIDLF